MPFVSPYDKPTRLEALRYYRRVVGRVQAGRRLRRDRRRGHPGRRGARRRRVVRRRHAFDPRRAPVLARAHGRRRHRRLRRPQSHRRARRGSAARLALLHAAAPVLPEEGRHRRRQELGGGGGARSLSRRRAGRRSSTVGAAMGESIKYWVKPDIDNRIKEGSIPARFDTRVVEIRPTTVVVERDGVVDGDRGRRRVPADRLWRGHDACCEARASRSIRRRAARSSTPRRSRPTSRALHRGRDGGRRAERPDLHRERPLPRREGDRSDSAKLGT